DWRLVNRVLKEGYVVLDKGKFVRVLEEFLKERLLERIVIDDLESIKPYLKEIERVVAKEKKKFEKIEFDRVDFSCFPPCMRNILADLRKGINIPHTARFAVTSFLLNIGLDTEQIIDLFKSAPDFDEEKTRYQVEHIAGSKGTEYDCPACDTMKTYQNCYEDNSCKKINHPISYYRRCMKRMKLSQKDGDKT
ncbi:DNA primase regulatory subunit PriL, partial [Archaeoglobales archaeon]